MKYSLIVGLGAAALLAANASALAQEVGVMVQGFVQVKPHKVCRANIFCVAGTPFEQCYPTAPGWVRTDILDDCWHTGKNGGGAGGSGGGGGDNDGFPEDPSLFDLKLMWEELRNDPGFGFY